ncbi:MAG TPA: gluconate 2-dehydrogenase subunit 3 family protein [Steroidobacteraceae bacterium]|nr:gluconate 2-dehydrogenase subunit 3 family protein [Steroidobacteraceae bacterium]
MDSRLLALVLDALIPPTQDGRLPGAGTLGAGAVVQNAAAATPGLAPLIEQGLEALEDIAGRRDAGGFAALSSGARVEALRELEEASPELLPTLLTFACVSYYSNERVLTALNGNARPPHPEGYDLEPDDRSLLEPVRLRGKLYREC